MRTSTTPIVRVEAKGQTAREDCVAVEEPLAIRLNGETVSITMRTPGDDEELTLGFLYGEGLLEQRDTVLAIQGGEVTLPPRRTPLVPMRRFPTHASCGVCGRLELPDTDDPPQRKGGPQLSVPVLLALSEQVRQEQAVFAATGGLHAAALFTPMGALLCLREDIGRHNAVDKVIGWALRQNSLPLSENLLFVSGRVSYELVQKAARAGIPVLAAVGAPSSLAVELCQDADITLVGFLRGERFNIYSGEWRIVS